MTPARAHTTQAAHAALVAGAIDVAVIGGGPAGLAAATGLKRAGVERVVVLEREAQAGGVPRHCGHYPFGMWELHRVLRGPDYAARLVARALAAGVELHVQTTVTALTPGPVLEITTPEGPATLAPARVLYATGMRETPRAARLIGGARVAGVMNTGALQAMVYLEHLRPFRKPLIVGSELVAFSAIMTCRHAGIRPVAMIEPGPRPRAFRLAPAYPALHAIPFYSRTRLLEIEGARGVEAAIVEGPRGRRRIACDGVILSGDFTPEAALARMGYLPLDPATGAPAETARFRTEDPHVFTAGNIRGGVRTAGASWREGQAVVAEILASLGGG